MTLLLKLFFGIICGISSSHAVGSSFTFPQGTVELVSSNKSLGLHFKLADEWHIYWKNSGDSGAAPKFNWSLQGATLGATHWPIPERITVEGLINFGYSHESLFVFDFFPDEAAEQIVADLNLEFLICKVECIPYFTNLSKKITNHDATGPPANLFTKFTYSEKQPGAFHWNQVSAAKDQLIARLSLPADISKNLKNIELFPENGEVFKTQSPTLEVNESSYEFTVNLQDTSVSDLQGSKFLVVLENHDGAKKAYDLTLQPLRTALGTILLWALIGGFILNFMPCVFPILSIKILSFLGPNKDHRQLRISGIFYTLGVIVSFLALGAVLLILRASGESIGWGFQLQSPVVAAGIAVLFFWLGLNFLGVFEIGHSLSSFGGKKTSSNHWGSFLTGVLATVVATPCTAPFMGAALGASLTLPPLATLLVFAGLGLGMAAPFLALAYFPQGLRFLPKPGMWMQRLKEFLAFPLFATVLWLLWVLSHQVSTDSILFILGLFVVIAFWIWFAKTIKSERATQRLLVIGFILSALSLAFMPKEAAQSATTTTVTSKWKDFNKEAITQDLQSGKAVFIDFTAAWCITCQVNKKVVLNTEDIQKLFTDNEVSLYKADWTDRSPVITEALAEYGRNSLPLYVFFAGGSSKAIILPEILTKGMIQNLFNKEITQ